SPARGPAPGGRIVCDEWMPPVEVLLSREQFHRLPRHPAYKYEYLSGSAWLTPRPRFYHALLDLRPLARSAADQRLRRLRPDDWAPLAAVFAMAFRSQQPFAGLEDHERTAAAERALEQTRSGGDGPWIA